MARHILILLALAGSAHAQTGPRTGGPAPGDFYGTHLAIDASLTGNLARGLIDRNLIIGRGGFNFWRGDYGLFVQPYYVYGDVNGNKTDDERYLRTLVFRTVAKPMFVYAVSALDHSLRRRIGRRGLFGGGVGATLVNNRFITFLTAVGLLYEVGDYDSNKLMDGTITQPYHHEVGRTSLRLYGRYKITDRKFSLFHDLYFIPAVRNFSDVRAMASIYAEVPIIGGFAARLQIDATHEDAIVKGTKEDDIAITFGVSFKNDWTLEKERPKDEPKPDEKKN